MRLRITLIVFAAFLLGAFLLALLIRNPGQWRWANSVSSFLSSKHAQQTPKSQAENQDMQGMEMPGQGEIKVTPGFRQNFGILTAVAESGTIPVDIRTVGTLAYNDRSIVSINTKFEGWIQKSYVNYIGQPVRAGETLFEIYSPELFSTQQEYLIALQYSDKMTASSASPESAQQAKSLLEAAAQRLRLWDITPDQIEELHKNRVPTKTLRVFSPVSGIVTWKMSDSLNGTRLSPGTDVYKIADLSTVWALIEVYEYQIRFLKLGQTAHITLGAFPGRHWMGKVVYLDPALNQETRTLAGKVEIANADGTLRPDMYADVEISVPAASGVRIPSQSVLHTGQRNVVILQKREGMFEPREVQLGSSGGGYTQVLSGIKPGDVVVTSSQFLIDSESNLAAAMAAMPGMQMGPSPNPKPSQQERPQAKPNAQPQQPGGMEGMPGMDSGPKTSGSGTNSTKASKHR